MAWLPSGPCAAADRVRFNWERVPRAPRPPVWAAVLTACWLLLVLAGLLLDQWGGLAMDTCLLHRLSGHPCPTCGSTRVVQALSQGAWLAALRFNPMVALGLPLGALWLGIRLGLGRALEVDLSSRERSAALILGLGVLVANWVWILRTQG